MAPPAAEPSSAAPTASPAMSSIDLTVANPGRPSDDAIPSHGARAVRSPSLSGRRGVQVARAPWSARAAHASMGAGGRARALRRHRGRRSGRREDRVAGRDHVGRAPPRLPARPSVRRRTGAGPLLPLGASPPLRAGRCRLVCGHRPYRIHSAAGCRARRACRRWSSHDSSASWAIGTKCFGETSRRTPASPTGRGGVYSIRSVTTHRAYTVRLEAVEMHPGGRRGLAPVRRRTGGRAGSRGGARPRLIATGRPIFATTRPPSSMPPERSSTSTCSHGGGCRAAERSRALVPPEHLVGRKGKVNGPLEHRGDGMHGRSPGWIGNRPGGIELMAGLAVGAALLGSAAGGGSPWLGRFTPCHPT